MSTQPPGSPDQISQDVGGKLGKEMDTFTERARASLAHAEMEARAFNHNYIGTEHLLLGLLDIEDSIAARVLTNLGLPPDKARQAVVGLVGPGSGVVGGEIGLTPRAKQALAFAREEARQLSHHYVGTEHLLLGLLRVTDGIAAGVLGNLGVDQESAAREIVRVLSNQPKGNVITCRVWPRDLEAIDLLLEAGIRTTRSDAAAWLIHAGIEGNRELFERVQATVADIRRLRQQVQEVARELGAGRPKSAGGAGNAVDVTGEV